MLPRACLTAAPGAEDHLRNSTETETTSGTCFDPTAAHSFASFSVYRPPFWPVGIDLNGNNVPFFSTASGITIMNMSDGPCADISFEVNNDTWYPSLGTPPNRRGQFNMYHRTDSGLPPIPFASEPAGIPGNVALTDGPPSGPAPTSCPPPASS